jgi:hypothetical protein
MASTGYAGRLLSNLVIINYLNKTLNHEVFFKTRFVYIIRV